jgi:photosystem II stability/assembly factor-like uncharacterized protein
MKHSFFSVIVLMHVVCSFNTVTAQWLWQTTPVTNRLLSVSFVSPQIGYAAGESGKFIRTTNGGSSWNSVNTGTAAAFNVVRFVNDTGYLFGNGPSVRRSTNGGTSWTGLSLTIPGATGLGEITSGTMFNGAVGIVCGYYVAGPNLKAFIARTTNAGTNWQIQSHDSVTSFWSMAFTSPMTGYVVGSTNSKYSPIFKTTDGGQTWTGLQSNTFSSLNSVHFVDAMNGIIGGSGGKILVTTDAGETWQQKSCGYYWITSVTATSAETVYAVSENGPGGTIYRSTDRGSSWMTQLNHTRAFSSITFINSNTGFASGDSGYIFKGSFSGATHVRTVSAATPQYQLEHNYPNPFNPSTTITFHVQQEGAVSVKIYDLLGKNVATLVSGQFASGSYSTQWNASGFSSGVYLMRMESGEFSETKRIVLMK